MAEFEAASPDFGFPADEQLEVYVSAAENPNHFWIQLVGGRSLQLDKLTSDMSQFYEGSGRAVTPCPAAVTTWWRRPAPRDAAAPGGAGTRLARPGSSSSPGVSRADLGSRGDVVFVKKALGRNKLLPQGLAVYASPENKKMFEEEKKLRQEGKLAAIQTQSGEKTVRFLRSCRLEVGMKNNVKWELNPEIVARHFFKNRILGVYVPPHAG
ncbi:PREDICTED: uncharacterized protein LOC104566740, partial [Tinamus guttatus]|uniref:uncharacterized protein LOC104566740 n=1 Tax=Tinamus guttatus TaxID=94827 RepID=UPI00052EC1EB